MLPVERARGAPALPVRAVRGCGTIDESRLGTGWFVPLTRSDTDRAYPGTVGELKDRRALQKARTREHVRTVAQRMFAEHGFDTVTIADVARAADVAVQTVFNHFSTKEELFFDGRIPWVDGPADAVRNRAPGIPVLVALRTCLVETVQGLVASHSSPERRRYIATLEASESLRVQEREHVHQAEVHLRDSLHAAWVADPESPDAPEDITTGSALIAAVWLSVVRSLVVGQRPQLSDGTCPERAALEFMTLTDRLLGQLETDMIALLDRHGARRRTDTGWPPVAMRRAG